MKSAFSITLLILISVAGLIPFFLMFVESNFGNGSFLSAADAYLLKPEGGIVYAILFAAGAFVALQIRSAFWAITLVPALLAALWPLFRHDQYELPVPTGAVVAFYQENALAPSDNMGCPQGWKYYSGLAGRFPLGAGKGDGLTERIIGSLPGGSETITLKINNLPKHRHRTATNNYGSGEHVAAEKPRSGNESFGHPKAYTDYNVYTGGQQPYNHMPPFRVMLYCEFTGETSTTVSN